MRSRPFLFRLGLAALGMVVFCLVAGLGVGWWIRTWPMRFEKVLGKSRAHRLTLGYARLLDALYPQDSDGDGISDLVEILLHKDPRNPGFHPNVRVRQDLGLVLTNPHRWPNGILWPRVPVQLGKPRRVYGWVGLNEEGGVFVPGMRLALEAPPGTFLGLPGGEISHAKLLVPVASNGAVVFEVITTIDRGPTHDGEIRAFHGFSHESAGSIALVVESGLPSFPAVATEIQSDDPERNELLVRSHHVGGSEYEHVVRVTWPEAVWSGVGPQGSILVEVTSDENGEDWIPIERCQSHIESCTYAYRSTTLPTRSRGPVRFRVVPMESSSPDP